MTQISLKLKNYIRNLDERQKTAFLSTVIVGLLAHMQIMVSDIPNHDGLAYIYDSQNVVTSGRWFLTVACGISSYFTLPWLIGVLGLFYLGIASGLMVKVLNVKSSLAAGLVGAMLASFPALASTFAYGFAMDGYMLSLLLAVAAVYVTAEKKWGWTLGMICLAFSMGIYQAYLPFAILLSLYSVLLIASRTKQNTKEKLFSMLHFLYMGIGGGVLYYVILKICLLLQGKVLDDYQGIENLSGGFSVENLPSVILGIYKDFVSFCLNSKVLVSNVYSGLAMLVLGITFLMCIIRSGKKNKWYVSPWFYVLMLLTLLVWPLGSGIIRLISPELNFHMIMRYQWVLLPICMVAFVDGFYDQMQMEAEKAKAISRVMNFFVTASAILSVVLVLCFTITDNIGYFNLNKKYEKTYGYMLRLLDRMEQTEGYYQGIPVALIGVVSSEEYPSTDLTEGVTGSMIGLPGDYLVYKAADYEIFWKQYMGASINILPQEKIGEIYYWEDYISMESFPAKDSIKVIDGILCVKTENSARP